ncbi:beta-propeller domain-containing protein [Thalassolituus maritimus]
MKMKQITACVIGVSTLLSGCFGSGGDRAIPEIEGELLEVYLKEGLVNRYGTGYVDSQTEIDFEESDTASDDTSGGDYSDTNTQEVGVDEADLVKQRGDYIYSAGYFAFDSDDSSLRQSGLKVYSVSTSPLSSKLERTIPLTGSELSDGLYLTDDQLIVLTPAQSGLAVYSGDADGEYYTVDVEAVSEVRFMSLADPAAPSETVKLVFSGDLLESRLIGNELYLVIQYQVSETRVLGPRLSDSVERSEFMTERAVVEMVNETPLENFLPQVWYDGQLSGNLFSDGLCHLPDATQGGYPSIITVVRINIESPDDWEAKCNSGRIHGVYASQDAFVLAGYDQEDWDATRLDWYTLDDFRLIATGSVPGTLAGTLPSFRLSEKDGYLRVLTSSSNFSLWDGIAIEDVTGIVASDVIETRPVFAGDTADHRLYTLLPNQDNGYDLVSQLPNLKRQDVIGKPGESVRSVRYRGDRAYVVTFRQTDPLYVINLEDEADPYIEGELEITGFSSYLHPLNDNLLLGLGYAATDTGFIEGLKLSLFDVSIPADPTEVSTMRLGGPASSAEAMSDNRASSYLRIDDHTTRLAFAWVDVNDDYEWVGDRVFVADIDESTQTFTEKLNLIYEGPGDDSDYYRYWNEYTRVLLHDDGLHFVRNGEVESGSLNDISFE